MEAERLIAGGLVRIVFGGDHQRYWQYDGCVGVVTEITTTFMPYRRMVDVQFDPDKNWSICLHRLRPRMVFPEACCKPIKVEEVR